MTVAVDPAEYAAAASQLSHVGEDAASAVITLVGVLEGSSGMAGSDPAGTSWAQEYDEAAKAALSASEGLVSAAGQVARLLHASGDNHSRADASSTAGGGDASMPAAPAPPDMSQPAVPSAAGGSGGSPFGWSLVEGAVGYVWPNGHQDRLLAAEAAWDAAAGGLRHAAGPIPAAAARVQAQQSPETAAASAACIQVGSDLGELAGVFTQIGQSCGQYAANLDHAHHEIITELEELVVETAAIEAGGAVLAFFTAGLDEVAAQAAVAARIAMVAAKIRRIIEALIEAARVVAAAVRGFAGKALEILGKLKPLLEAGVKKAKAVVVKGGEKVGTRAADAMSLPSGVEGFTKGELSSALSTEPDTAFFWSGRTSAGSDVGPGAAANIAAPKGGTTLESLMESRGVHLPPWGNGEDPAVVKAWEAVSDTYAQGVSGEVRAVVGSDLRPRNVWQTVELPRLMSNPKVTRIIQIDPETGVESILFP